jgi:RNA polymerase sigma-70 factor (ECF subfamily)
LFARLFLFTILSLTDFDVRVEAISRYMNQEEMEKMFNESFAEYGDAIFRFCIVKVSNVELAEDMTQEVFTRYWQYLRDGKEMTNTRSFLYTIANNLAKDWYKKKKALSLDERIETKGEPRGGEASPQVMAEYQELITAIEDMEDKDKEVLLLKYVEGLDPKDIAVILEESANTISVRINRATKRLQQKLDYE